MTPSRRRAVRWSSSSRAQRRSSVKSGAAATPASAWMRSGSEEGHQQHDPGAHAGPDEQQAPRDALLQHGERVVPPLADRPVDQTSGRQPVALVVEPEEGALARPTPGFEVLRLGAGHVGRVSAEEDHGRFGPRVRHVREPGPAVPGEEAHARRPGRHWRGGHRPGRRAPLAFVTRAAPRTRRPAGESACRRCTGSVPAGSSRSRSADPSPPGGRRGRPLWKGAPRSRSCRPRSARS